MYWQEWLTALSVNSNVIAILEPTDGYQTFTLNTTNNITRVLINNPPINLLDASMLADFHTLLTGPASNLDGPKAIIFSSANPEYFIAHLDIHILSSDHPVPPPLNNTELSNLYVNVTRLLATVPAILIAEVSGQAIAAGNEMIVQMDMRFASPGARLGAAEVGVGLTHAAGGLQHLTRLIGPGRAAEYLLGIIDADLDTLADIGWVNSAFESAAEMQAHVDALASRIALWPRGGLVATKQGIREGGWEF
ncbi:ClpP/crotonase [Mollisia scopiformis]|uniref:ClpP/crotonase n=1 Tax=Mollisia scopiformis TaxID=149040 RepID=A0A194XGE1_MOLSC|nr:ClpP/crotonase [Mollisia scopiformis]KUJ19233.1 ClpP/crotonase [Mollisia scopiformis]